MVSFVLDVVLGMGITVAVGLFVLMALTGFGKW